MIRETVLDGEPSLDVDTEEEFDHALSSRSSNVIAAECVASAQCGPRRVVK